MKEPAFLTVDDVRAIHHELIEAYGGQHGVRDAGAVEGATMQVQASFGGQYLHETLWEMAAAYAFYLAQSQAFIDGNKRVGAGAALAFLAINGRTLGPSANNVLYSALIAISAHTLDRKGLALILEQQAAE